eukprot:TRINITY_DN54318_c0_g1_i1.p1 TRINITY_DN54318_c0_g1~~TRINITY_DN54318_c0_g1_i1.p1  ORF type:complete len:167 (+),score=29.24 TRINITY_DN54318_c0_g1_i1:31-501(+)
MAMTILPFGVLTAFLQWPPCEKSSCKEALKTLGGALVTPGITEEILFRVLPLQVGAWHGQWSRLAMMLIVFAVPFHVDSFHHLGPIKIFADRRFLTMALGLGIASTYAFVSSGSLWLAALTHGLPVWAWLSFFGGLEQLQDPDSRLNDSDSSSSSS